MARPVALPCAALALFLALPSSAGSKKNGYGTVENSTNLTDGRLTVPSGDDVVGGAGSAQELLKQRQLAVNHEMRSLEDDLRASGKFQGAFSGEATLLFARVQQVNEPEKVFESIDAFAQNMPEGIRDQVMNALLPHMAERLAVVAALPGSTPVGAAADVKKAPVGGADASQPAKAEIRPALMALVDSLGASPVMKGIAVTAPGQAAPKNVFTMATQAIDGGVKDPQVYLVRGGAAEKLGDYQQANSDALFALRANPSDKVAQSLYQLTKARPSVVRLLDGKTLPSERDKLAAAEGSGRPDAGGPGAGPAGATGGAEASGLSAEQIAAQENAALNARPVTARSAELTRDAKSALRVRDTKSALRLTEEAIQADPGNADARYVRATAFLQMKEPARAAYEASAGLELAPGNGPLLYTRAVANGRQKLWREAYVDAEDAVRNAPRAGYAYQVRAAANWALGRKAEMMQDLRTSASLDRAYAAAAQRATQQPADVDPTLLFSDEPAPAAQAAAPAAAAPAPRYALWAVGGVLAVLGLLPVFSSGVRSKVTTVFRRGPAVAEGEPAGGADVPVTGFWKRYEVTREIGAGGMGVVYEAWDRQLERRAAVKRMRDEIRNDRRERERFLQEARMVARLRHPNLVEIYSIEEDGPDAYLVFEFVEGQNLHEMLQEKGRFTPAEARDVFRGLCAGVDYAHRQGVVHRDLKPANVIVEPDGTVKVMDFGVARQAQDAMARRQMTNTIIGTPQYMAPEQEEGVVCTQSDVYALGVCLYEMLAGVPPFNGSAGAVTLAKRESRYEPLAAKVADLPPAVAQVVERALDPNPQTRTRTAADFLKDLEAAVSGVAA